MTTILGRLKNAYDQFMPASAEDPRCQQKDVAARPIYHLGEGWTPTPDQISEARARQASRRANISTQWRRLASGSELDTVRAIATCATDFQKNEEAAAQRQRTLRSMLFDDETEFYVRKMRVSNERFLIEIRHPKLMANSAAVPVGFRFLGLSRDFWKHQDHLGIALDGELNPIRTLFRANFESTVKEPDLTEAYVRFVFDHVEFNHTQFYIVADRQDFIASERITSPPSPERFFTAQLRVSELPQDHAVDSEADDLLRALKIPEEALVPPTVLRTVPATDNVPAHAIVFLTTVYVGALYHMCLRVSADGLITSTDHERQFTPKDVTLPLAPIRSFAEQRAALKRSLNSIPEEVT